jgi:hypothetical protein
MPADAKPQPSKRASRDARYGDTPRGRQTRREAQARYALSEGGARRRHRYALVYNLTTRYSRATDRLLAALGKDHDVPNHQD